MASDGRRNKLVQLPELPASYVRVFQDRDSVAVFRDSRWQSVLLPYGLHLEDEIAEALFLTVATVGDGAITVTDVEPIVQHQNARRIPVSMVALQEVRAGTPLGHLDSRILGDSGRWGGEIAHEGLLLLGGDDAFLRTFVVRAGGIPRLRERYERFMEEEWLEPPEAAARLKTAVRWPPA